MNDPDRAKTQAQLDAMSDAEHLLRDGYPPAPVIGGASGDSYDVAEWLRKLAAFMHGTSVEEGVAIDEAITLFEHANPETKP